RPCRQRLIAELGGDRLSASHDRQQHTSNPQLQRPAGASVNTWRRLCGMPAMNSINDSLSIWSGVGNPADMASWLWPNCRKPLKAVLGIATFPRHGYRQTNLPVQLQSVQAAVCGDRRLADRDSH